MAKQLPDLNEILPNFVSDGDYLLIRDTSAREDKKIKVGDLVSMVFLLSHAIGSTYTTYAEDDDPNRFGGSWELAAKGRSIIGVDPADPDFNSADMTGGEKTHTLTVAEMPSHWHRVTSRINNSTGNDAGSAFSIGRGSTGGSAHYSLPSSTVTNTDIQGTNQAVGALNTGGDEAHNNLHPYETAFIWRRTA